MELADFLKPEDAIAGLRTAGKAQLLRDLAGRAAPAVMVAAPAILDALLAREKLGSTGLGQGIALPHARIEGVRRLFGLFAHLERPIDFAAIDDKPVDLVFLLLIPAGAGAEHLAALATISRRLRDKEVLRLVRSAQDQRALFNALTGPGSAAGNPPSR